MSELSATIQSVLSSSRTLELNAVGSRRVRLFDIRESSDPIRREQARMTRCRPIALLAALLILGMSATPDAIAQKATVEGHARAEEGGAPVQFALVRLVPADASPLPSDGPPQGLTNADGRYRFDGVPPGFARGLPEGALLRPGGRTWRG